MRRSVRWRCGKSSAPTIRGTVSDLFGKKADNLASARRLLAETLTEYDQSGMWRLLDERASRLDIDDVSERWARGLVEHPFPIALLSLQFNWRYMKEHGVRAFYEMTASYVDGLSTNTHRWAEAWAAEAATGVIDRVTTGPSPHSSVWTCSRRGQGQRMQLCRLSRTVPSSSPRPRAALMRKGAGLTTGVKAPAPPVRTLREAIAAAIFSPLVMPG
ncbi:hypothetical protein ACIBI3_09100 [Actinomadura luteofluorescens]|uniref:hypothetical protein n=1 Tax=Actinomadura luteofluorescens TaxID=46163 RepID=UPI0034932811